MRPPQSPNPIFSWFGSPWLIRGPYWLDLEAEDECAELGKRCGLLVQPPQLQELRAEVAALEAELGEEILFCIFLGFPKFFLVFVGICWLLIGLNRLINSLDILIISVPLL